MSHKLYVPIRQSLELDCRSVGENSARKWYFNDKEEVNWNLNNQDLGGQVKLASVTRENDGNFTCQVENEFGSDSVAFEVNVQGT